MRPYDTDDNEYLIKKLRERYGKLIAQIGVEPDHPNFSKDVDFETMADVIAAKLDRVILQNEAIITVLAGLARGNSHKSKELYKKASKLQEEAHITELEGSCLAFEKYLNRKEQK